MFHEKNIYFFLFPITEARSSLILEMCCHIDVIHVTR